MSYGVLPSGSGAWVDYSIPTSESFRKNELAGGAAPARLNITLRDEQVGIRYRPQRHMVGHVRSGWQPAWSCDKTRNAIGHEPC